MRKDLGAKPLCYPQPVFIIAAYDEDGRTQAMNAAWGGIHDTKELYMCLSASHKTVKCLLARKEFTVSMGTAEYAAQCDYLGIVSGNDVPDKFERSGFHSEKAAHVDAPVICELPMALECSLSSYDPETGSLVADIINVSVDEKVMDEQGKVDIGKLRPITFDPFNMAYVELGVKAGNAFSDGRALKK